MAAALYFLCILLVANGLTAQSRTQATETTTHGAPTNQTEHTTETSRVTPTATTRLTTHLSTSTSSACPTNSTETPSTVTTSAIVSTTRQTTQTPTQKPTEKPTSHTTRHTTQRTTVTTHRTTEPTHSTPTPTRTTPTTTVVPSTTVTTTRSPTTNTPSSTPSSATTPTHATTATSSVTHSPSTSPRTTVTGSSSPGTSTALPTPTTPPSPTSPTKPWKVTYGTNGTNCIMVKFAAQIDISYVNVHNKTVRTGFDIPANASVNEALSMCDKKGFSEVFALDFESQSIANGYLVAIFHKDKRNVSSLFELLISYPISEEVFPGISPSYHNKVILLASTNLSLYGADPKHSYSCNSLLSVNFTSIQVKDIHHGHFEADSESVFKESTFETRDLKVQAFLPTDKNMDIFMPGTLCSGDLPDTLWTVDFIVALVIAGLTLIVLVAYFVARRIRNKASSDETLPIVAEE